MVKDPMKDKKLNRMFEMARLESDMRAMDKAIAVLERPISKEEKKKWVKIVREWLTRATEDKNRLKKLM